MSSEQPPKATSGAAPEPLAPSLPFTRTTSHLVAGFTCVRAGAAEEPWDADARRWITAAPAQGGAIDSVELLRDSVWLYLDDADKVLGFVSLGVGPRLPGATERAQTLPHLALHANGRGRDSGRACSPG